MQCKLTGLRWNVLPKDMPALTVTYLIDSLITPVEIF